MIDPMLFYWIGFCDTLRTFCTCIFVTVGSMVLVGALVLSLAGERVWPCKGKGGIKFIIFVLFITALGASFLPNRITAYQMLAAKYITINDSNNFGDVLANNIEKIVKATADLK